MGSFLVFGLALGLLFLGVSLPPSSSATAVEEAEFQEGDIIICIESWDPQQGQTQVTESKVCEKVEIYTSIDGEVLLPPPPPPLKEESLPILK